MYFLMTTATKGDKAVHVFKLMAHDGHPVHLVALMMYLQRIGRTAYPALVAVTQPYLSFHLLPIGIVGKAVHICGLAPSLMLESTHHPVPRPDLPHHTRPLHLQGRGRALCHVLHR